MSQLETILREYSILLLVVPLVLLSAAYAFRAWRGKRPARHAVEDGSVAAIAIEPGTKLSRIPAYRARLQWHCARAEPDVIALLDDLFAMGLSLAASDLHFTPAATETSVALRVHGALYDLGRIPGDLYVKLVSRVKVMASMAIYKRAIPQDGEIDLHSGQHRARVSVLPTNHGEKVVMRLASAQFADQGIAALGMTQTQEERFVSLLNANQGMIIVTGPTGSGKTTSMYAGLLHINASRGSSTNIVTLEDPIEFDFPQFSQTQILPDAGMTFAVGLRSILRQDPDVILVGEIRDDETASIAMRAAMTGHLIFTTLHADRAAGVFNRIIQMGVERYQMASAVRGVISQRLCQRLCASCRVETPLTEAQRRQFAFIGMDTPPEGPFYTATGCPDCLDKGVDGRVAVYEMLVVTDAVRDLINEGKPTHQIEKLAREQGMESLFDDGLQRARDGLIAIDDVLRVLAA